MSKPPKRRKQPMPPLFGSLIDLAEPIVNRTILERLASAPAPTPLEEGEQTIDAEPVWETAPDDDTRGYAERWESQGEEDYGARDSEQDHQAEEADAPWMSGGEPVISEADLVRFGPRPPGTPAHLAWPPPPFGQRWTRPPGARSAEDSTKRREGDSGARSVLGNKPGRRGT